jgi:hypothetical protein
MKATQQLQNAGQSLWLDHITGYEAGWPAATCSE